MFKPTDEQKSIVDLYASTSSHILVIARAGAAKTTTLCLLADATPQERSGLALAFNVSMKKELAERLPSNFECMTLNGLGHRVWGKFLGKRLRLEKTKVYHTLRAVIEELDDKKDQDAIWENFSEIRMCIEKAKNAGFVPGPLPQAFRPLCSEIEFFESILDIETDELERDVIIEVCRRSFADARQGIIDFADQLLCPAIAGCSFPHFNEVFVDEAQDLGPIEHKLIKKLVRKGTRLVAVGDPLQAIYGFRGADTESIQTFESNFAMEKRKLTLTFRCGERLVANAQWRAPDLRAANGLAPGEVLRPDKMGFDDIPDHSAVICRNNAPIFALAIRLLRDGRYPELLGRDIVKAVVAKMKKLGKTSLKRSEAEASLRGWHAAQKARQRDHRLLADTVACMNIFLAETETLGDAIKFAESLEQRSGHIKLCTGHRAKGLEFDEVFFLDPQLINKKYEQDLNLQYVIETRAKRRLTYVTSEMLYGEEAEEV